MTTIFYDLFDNEIPIPMADSRMIGLIAAKKNFNPDKERMLIEKAKTTKCRCKHWTGTEPCLYRQCRHFTDTHYKKVLEEVAKGSFRILVEDNVTTKSIDNPILY